MKLSSILEIKKVVLIGAGNVATHLGISMYKKDIDMVQVWSRTIEASTLLAEKVDAMTCKSLKNLEQSADLYILSVPDHAIESVLSQIVLEKDQLLVHTSGSLPMSVLKLHSANIGVFYPLQTFSKGKNVDFETIPLLLEANSLDSSYQLIELATKLSNSIATVDSEKRKILHLAAVFACNFPNFLYSVAEELLGENELDFNLLRPLILETAAKIKDASPKDVQTGPAIRNDEKTIENHMRMLEQYPEYARVYQILTELIRESTKY